MSALEALAKASEAIKWIAVILGLVIFLVFFALAPLHAMILFGLAIIALGLYFPTSDLSKFTIFTGIMLLAIGTAGVIIPTFEIQIRSVAESFRELLLLG